MKHKSLRQLAKELGVSASYLSQVNHGKKRLSNKIARALTNVNQSVNQFPQNTNQIPQFVAKSGSIPLAGRRTSNPLGGVRSVFGGFDSHTLPPLAQ